MNQKVRVSKTRSVIILYFLSCFFNSPIFGQIQPPCLVVDSLTSITAKVTWAKVDKADFYKLRYRKTGEDYWRYFILSQNEKKLENLLPYCTYDLQAAVISNSITGNYSSIQNFKTKIPRPDHIVVLILENHGYNSIIGSPAAPFINSLVQHKNCAMFTNSHGLHHPSQPNYLELFSGSDQGVNDNGKPALSFTTPNLFSYLYKAGITFSCYSESLPMHGFNGETSGAYARKHNPVANWMGKDTNQVPSNKNVPFTNFPADPSFLPDFCYVVPNQDNDMHNGFYPANIITCDDWIKTNLGRYIKWCMNNNSLLIITYDEDEWTSENHIPTLFYGPMVKGGQYDGYINHHHVLRTLEEIYETSYAGKSADSEAIGCWQNSLLKDDADPGKIETGLISDFNCNPNPANTKLEISFKLNRKAIIHLEIFDIRGKKINETDYEKLSEAGSYDHLISTGKVIAGIYILRLTADNERYEKKVVIYH